MSLLFGWRCAFWNPGMKASTEFSVYEMRSMSAQFALDIDG